VGTETMFAGQETSGAKMPALRPPTRCQGAMSQQGSGAHGNESYPQKLVQLVGHRDPEARLEAWGRLQLKGAVGEGLK
jgi:hypothetical protein